MDGAGCADVVWLGWAIACLAETGVVFGERRRSGKDVGCRFGQKRGLLRVCERLRTTDRRGIGWLCFLYPSFVGKSSANRSKRGAMSVARFKIIGELVWDAVNGRSEEVWDNQSGG